MSSESNPFYEEELDRQRLAADSFARAQTERREYGRLVRRLNSLILEMEFIGENYMGLLQEHMAGRYHAATDTIRTLVHDLTQDAAWPRDTQERDL